MKYFIVAGERSGDLHASKLAQQIIKRDRQAQMAGFGGRYMEEAGVQILKHYSSFSFMGIFEVIKNLGQIKGTLKEAKQAIRAYDPDVLILVDFPGINLRLATFAKRSGIRTCYYISPKIWAWGGRRIKRIKRDVDKMLVILPFEVAFYKTKNYRVDYVGNPLIDAIRDYNFDSSFCLSPQKVNIAVLPGSRKQELVSSARIIQKMATAAPSYQFHVAAVDNVADELYDCYRTIPNVSVYFNKTYELLKQVNVAVVTSGTATLETALLNCPQVVVYRGNPFTIFIGRLLVRVKWVSLVNLIADKEVVRELIQGDYHPKGVFSELRSILRDHGYCAGMLADYQRLREKIGTGSASNRAAEMITEWLGLGGS